jgi:hypothetical protein
MYPHHVNTRRVGLIRPRGPILDDERVFVGIRDTNATNPASRHYVALNIILEHNAADQGLTEVANALSMPVIGPA